MSTGQMSGQLDQSHPATPHHPRQEDTWMAGPPKSQEGHLNTPAINSPPPTPPADSFPCVMHFCHSLQGYLEAFYLSKKQYIERRQRSRDTHRYLYKQVPCNIVTVAKAGGKRPPGGQWITKNGIRVRSHDGVLLSLKKEETLTHDTTQRKPQRTLCKVK